MPRDILPHNEYGFSLNREYSRDYGIILLEPPPIVFAKRDVTQISVPGRSGDLIIDGGRYRNVTIPYKCAISPKFEYGSSDLVCGMREKAITAINRYAAHADYRRLENTFDPGHYRLARISEDVDVESLVEKAGKFTLKFDCKPQRYLKSGEFALRIASAATLRNSTNCVALPLITVYGSGAGTVTIGGVTVEIKTMEDQITLDCDTKNAYRQVGEGAAENKNGSIYAPDFPELLPGDNVVSFTGGITTIEIIPRWWEL